MFSDSTALKYVIDRRNFYEAKQEAREIQDEWNEKHSDCQMKDFLIKEIRNEDNRKQKSSNNSGYSPKSKVRRNRSEEDEE